MAITPFKVVEMVGLCQSGKSFGWFWGVCFFLFLFGAVLFLIFDIFKILDSGFSNICKNKGAPKFLKTVFMAQMTKIEKVKLPKKSYHIFLDMKLIRLSV